MNNESLKKLAVIVVVSLAIFFLLKPRQSDDENIFGGKGKGGDKTKGSFIKKPRIDESLLQEYEHIAIAYDGRCGYIDAVNAREAEEVLGGICDSFRQDCQMEIYEDSNGNLAVRDLEGNDILKY